VLPSESEPQDVIKVDTDLVPIDVTVTDSKGRLVRNLKKEDFRLFEDGIERSIASFNVEKIEGAPRPVAIVFALDLSGQREELTRLADAVQREIRERDVLFDDRRVTAPLREPVTQHEPIVAEPEQKLEQLGAHSFAPR